MIHTQLALLFFGVALAITPSASFASAGDASFRQGVLAYESGDLSSAAEHFEASLQSGESASARHNLALARFRSGEKGDAAWQLERALALEPLNAAYRAKLHALRKNLGLESGRQEWIDIGANLLPHNIWLLLAIFTFWSLACSVVFPRLAGHRPRFLLKSCMLLLALAFLVSTAANVRQLNLRSTGLFITQGPAELKAAPSESAPVSGLARPAERGRITGRHGEFLQVRTESGSSGWVHPDAFRPLFDS